MVGHAMPTTFVGHCLQKVLLFAFKGVRSLLKANRSQSSPPTMFRIGSIPAVLASWKAS